MESKNETCNINVPDPNLGLAWVILAVGLLFLGGCWLDRHYDLEETRLEIERKDGEHGKHEGSE